MKEEKSKEMREAASHFSTQRIISKSTKWGLKFDGYRSLYDHRLAQYFDEIGLEFQYEQHGIEVKNEGDVNLHYIPDFYIPSKDVYVEVVNKMHKTLRHKILWFQEQHPDKRLMLVTRNEVNNFFRGKGDLF
jgi:predicted nuclease of restriction endonuclease-like RecB superfamily